eukprot:TRINITY_DN44983_c0_g1_i1.p1 TRINITY_DN44983_c0_g1~~TRINITY_DN44983_c0_g1_i1.p1  ORF type:complete len:679 (+),score=139.52 TRINITY_DN44983_c0_g1_i1:86-2122(+)
MAMRQGLGRIKAEVVAGVTRLTEIGHSAPARLFPVMSPGVEKVGAAGFFLGGYGGGVLGGDHVQLDVRVGAGATLLGRTQGTTKIYRTNRLASVQLLEAEIDCEGLLVLAPDAIMPFKDARYEQRQRFYLAEGASAVVVDGVSCGRASRGERWDFRHFSSSSEYFDAATKEFERTSEPSSSSSARAMPFLSDAIVMDAPERGGSNWSMDLGGVERDAFASVVAIGPRAAKVAAELGRVAAAVAARNGARVAGETAPASGPGSSSGYPDVHEIALPTLGGAVCMGVSHGIPGGRSDVAMARIVGELPEDVLRVVAACLSPLEEAVGEGPYADRLHGTSAAARPHYAPAEPTARPVASEATSGKQSLTAAAPTTPGRQAMETQQLWALLQLADPTLPIGGFAHSGGLEAALQLGVFRDSRGRPIHGTGRGTSEASLVDWLTSAAWTTARLHYPSAESGHTLVTTTKQRLAAATDEQGFKQVLDDFKKDWAALNRELSGLLSSVSPAHRASTLQGIALLRVAVDFFRLPPPRSKEEAQASKEEAATARLALHILAAAIEASTPEPHFACAMGAATSCLGLPAEAALDAVGFAASRGLVAAAVRLNLVGPQRSVALQAAAGRAAMEAGRAFASSLKGGVDSSEGSETSSSLSLVGFTAGCTAPLLDATHATHDLLEARVFRT